MVEVSVIGIEGGDVAAGTSAKMNGQWPVEWLVFVTGLTTACMAAIYKVPAGIFDDHKRAYYVSVVSAGVAGLAEVFAAVVWMSGSAGPNPHGLTRRCVLCALFLPLAFVAGLGGARILLVE